MERIQNATFICTQSCKLTLKYKDGLILANETVNPGFIFKSDSIELRRVHGYSEHENAWVITTRGVLQSSFKKYMKLKKRYVAPCHAQKQAST